MQTASAKIPTHIAIIMDGNGRWAKQRGLPRIEGHRRGVETARAIIDASRELGIRYLTLYAFSVENWSRPRAEVSALMGLLEQFLRRETKVLVKNHIRLHTIGRTAELPAGPRAELERAVKATSQFEEWHLVLALNYGGRGEILDAARAFAGDALRQGRVPEADEESFGRYLYDPAGRDVDLLIRTGGDHRVSNFLLWEVSYSELWFTKDCWPDFGIPRLHEALGDFARRDRRFGGLHER